MPLSKKQKLMQKDLIGAIIAATVLTALFFWWVPTASPLGLGIVWVILLIGINAGFMKYRAESKIAYEDLK